MADDLYVADLAVTSSATVTLPDDGSGIDALTVSGLYGQPVEFTLAWSSTAGLPDSASVIFYVPNGFGGFEGRRLVVTGVIENAFGTDGRDFIQGNVLANEIHGDGSPTGPGQADTLWGGSGNDTIRGGAGDDQILGDGEDDLLFGDAGADAISGGGGTDTVEGGAGADTLSGGATVGDMLSYAGSLAGVRIAIEYGSTTTGLGGDAAGDQVTGFLNVQGSAQADRIEDLGKGTVAFGYNANVFSGGDGGDRLILGGGDDQGLGGGGNDDLSGEIGNDTLSGGAGSDVLRGGRGQDWLTGGTGGDRFVFRTPGDSTVAEAQRDRITDFTSAQGDVIDLSGIDAKAGVAGDQAFQLITTAFTGQRGELRLRDLGSDLLVLGDVNGDGTADFAILVHGVASLGAGDFAL